MEPGGGAGLHPGRGGGDLCVDCVYVCVPGGVLWSREEALASILAVEVVTCVLTVCVCVCARRCPVEPGGGAGLHPGRGGGDLCVDCMYVCVPGGVLWSREEALASILAVEVVDLPMSANQVSIEEEFGDQAGESTTMYTTVSRAAESVKFQPLRLRLRLGKIDSDSNSDSEPHQSLFSHVEGQCFKTVISSLKCL